MNREALLSAAVLMEREKSVERIEREREREMKNGRKREKKERKKQERKKEREKKEKSREQMLVTIGPHPIPSLFFQY